MADTTNHIDTDSLRAAFQAFFNAFRKKVAEEQEGVTLYHDNYLAQRMQLIYEAASSTPWDKGLDAVYTRLKQLMPEDEINGLIAHMFTWHQGRFLDYAQRVNIETASEVITDFSFVTADEIGSNFSMSQGRYNCISWKDHLMFKTSFDLAIYQMLIWELKPNTILEIGSGNGGSAIWMADLCKMYDLDCKVLSLDIKKVEIVYDGVEFVTGDCNQIEGALSNELLASLPHPWLVIEDAHINVGGVLRHLHPHLQVADYLVVEDSWGKQGTIRDFLGKNPSAYAVDARYCDFFGRNVTSAPDSIFRRI